MTVRLGFVGTGGIAGRHFESLADIPEAKVVACTDVDSDRAARAAARFAGAAAYTDHREMLENHDLDAAYVCVPPHVHGDIEMALIERGVPFFLEKPLANDIEVPRRILDAVEERGLLTSVGYMMRYRDTAELMREHLAENTPVTARGAYLCGIPGAPWWRRKEQSGGQVVEQSTHVFDLARFLLGEVETVYCIRRRDLITDVEEYTADDASICSLVFEDGTLCEITSSCAVEKGEMSLEVFTRKTRAKLSGSTLTVRAGREARTVECGTNAFLEEDRTFIEAVVSGDGSGIKSTYADAFKTQAVTCAANESMESGEPVAP